jgi:parallel beta-helix repeat protein
VTIVSSQSIKQLASVASNPGWLMERSQAMKITLNRFLTLAALLASTGALMVGCSTEKDTPSGTTTAATRTATLTWAANDESDVAAYKVYFGTASGAFGAPIDAGKTTSYQVTGLTIGQTYKFAVTAVDTSNNESNFPNEVITVITNIAQGGSPGQATTYYVDKIGGLDANSCAQAMNQLSPKQTITSGISCLSAGDTLIVKAGTYDESFDDPFANTGTSWVNKITVKAEVPRSVIIKAMSGDYVMTFQAASQRYIEFNGIEIDASNALACGVCIAGEAHHIRFKNSAILNAANQGVSILTGAGASPDYNEFINVEVANSALNRPCFGRDGINPEDGYCHGFYISSNNNFLDGVNVHHNNGYGVQFFPQGNRGNTIRNSLSHDNLSVGIGSFGDDNRVVNNVVYNNNGGGLLIEETNNLVHNNTVHNNPQGISGLTVRGTGHLVKNNLFFLNDVFGIQPDTTNLVGTDPLFTDAAGGNFRLQATSPAINTGVPLLGVATDFDSIRRPQGNVPDIGAYEFSGNVAGDIVAPVPPADLTVL